MNQISGLADFKIESLLKCSQCCSRMSLSTMGQISCNQLRKEITTGSIQRLEMLRYKHYMALCSAFTEHFMSQFCTYSIAQHALSFVELMGETRGFNCSSPKLLSWLIPSFHFPLPIPFSSDHLSCCCIASATERRHLNALPYAVAEMLNRALFTFESFQSGDQAIYILPKTEPYYIHIRTNQGMRAGDPVQCLIKAVVINTF